MKPLLWIAIVIAVAALAIAAWVTAQQTARPPGVDEASWIALSPNAGIVLVDLDRIPMATRLPGIQPELARFPEGTGILMVRVDGLWTRIDWSAAPPRVQPLH